MRVKNKGFLCGIIILTLLSVLYVYLISHLKSLVPTETMLRSTAPKPSMIFYERNPRVSFYLDGLAITSETMGQIMKGIEMSHRIQQLIEEDLCTPKEIRHDYYEIYLNKSIEEMQSYTLWMLFRPYSMYAFNNVFLSDGDKLSLYSSNDGLFLLVEHSSGESMNYRGVLVFIE